MKYIIELHCHSKETSGCSTVAGKDLVHLYKSKNYDAITVTDHYDPGFFERRRNEGITSWREIIDRHLRGYRAAKEEGDKIGMNVILGMEFRFTENMNDYLVFGITEEILYENEDLCLLGIEKFYEFSKANNLITIQAHPFRNGMKQIDSQFLDGIEIYNGHPSHHSRNGLAKELYKSVAETRPSYIKTAGSDCHNRGHEATAALVSDTLPQNSIELKNLLISGDYKFCLPE